MAELSGEKGSGLGCLHRHRYHCFLWDVFRCGSGGGRDYGVGDESGGVVEEGAFEGGEVDLGDFLVCVAQAVGDY